MVGTGTGSYPMADFVVAMNYRVLLALLVSYKVKANLKSIKIL